MPLVLRFYYALPLLQSYASATRCPVLRYSVCWYEGCGCGGAERQQSDLALQRHPPGAPRYLPTRPPLSAYAPPAICLRVSTYLPTRLHLSAYAIRTGFHGTELP
eukprot:2230705-Rhodomonas_salina.1